MVGQGSPTSRRIHIPPPGADDVTSTVADEHAPPGAVSLGSYDPAAEGWEAHTDTEFVGLVGPLWIRQEGDRRAYGLWDGR